MMQTEIRLCKKCGMLLRPEASVKGIDVCIDCGLLALAEQNEKLKEVIVK